MEFAHGAVEPARAAVAGVDDTRGAQLSLQLRCLDLAQLSCFRGYADRYARMFESFRPRGRLLYEHMFCSPRTSKLTQRARDALALTRAFLLLEDDNLVDWEVGEEDFAAASKEGQHSHEPAWAPAHRASLRVLRAPRRGGQPAAPPQVCLCPTGPERNIYPALPTPRSSLATSQNTPICRAFAKPGERGGVFCAEPPAHV